MICRTLKSVIIVIPMLIMSIGCGGSTYIPQSNESMPPSIKIVGVKYKSGEYLKFINQDAVYDKNLDQIWGQIENGKSITIKMNELESIKVEDFSEQPAKEYFAEISEFRQFIGKK